MSYFVVFLLLLLLLLLFWVHGVEFYYMWTIFNYILCGGGWLMAKYISLSFFLLSCKLQNATEPSFPVKLIALLHTLVFIFLFFCIKIEFCPFHVNIERYYTLRFLKICSIKKKMLGPLNYSFWFVKKYIKMKRERKCKRDKGCVIVV